MGRRRSFVSERKPSAPPSCSITRRVQPEPRSRTGCRRRTGQLLDALSQAPGASADSSAEALFEMPNDSDFTPFVQAGLYGYDTGIAGDAYYHSPLDDPAHLSTCLPPADG